jgi:hypothetical protein
MDTDFTISRKFWTLLGAKFYIHKADGTLLGFCKQKAFKLKEDIRVYTDEALSEERLLIQARSVIDFSSAYDVVDSQAQTKIGALRRKGFTSIFRDSWIVLDESEREIGALHEDSTAMALVRRYVPLGYLVPQKFSMLESDGQEIANFRGHFNLIVSRMTVSVHEGCPVHPFLVLAAGLLLLAIEGRQRS